MSDKTPEQKELEMLRERVLALQQQVKNLKADKLDLQATALRKHAELEADLSTHRLFVASVKEAEAESLRKPPPAADPTK